VRTRVYVDGYNLYYGCLKGTAFKWLDLQTLFRDRILPSSSPTPAELAGIKYFTASILERAARALDSVSSQSRYHTALTKLYPADIEVIKGYYSMTKAMARVVDAGEPDKWPRDCQEIQVWKFEEKQSDVSLALHAYHDASRGDVDQVVIVTNDTDIAPALQMIRAFTAVRIGLVIPTRSHERIPNTELAACAHWVRTHITDEELAASQLPRVIRTGRRPTIRPTDW
jgi:6-hydroxy-3-succinoylpyridine 3-monooxygenase